MLWSYLDCSGNLNIPLIWNSVYKFKSTIRVYREVYWVTKFRPSVISIPNEFQKSSSESGSRKQWGSWDLPCLRRRATKRSRSWWGPVGMNLQTEGPPSLPSRKCYEKPVPKGELDVQKRFSLFFLSPSHSTIRVLKPKCAPPSLTPILPPSISLSHPLFLSCVFTQCLLHAKPGYPMIRVKMLPLFHTNVSEVNYLTPFFVYFGRHQSVEALFLSQAVLT